MPSLNSLVPMMFVASVPRSIEFYAKVGFEVDNTFVPPGQTEPSWAWLRSGGAHLMVAASEPVPAEIEYPFYAPRGEFRVKDPDRYALMVTHT